MYLYIIECVVRKYKNIGKNPFKIGITEDLENRICAIQNGCPFAVKYVAVIKVESRSKALEKEKYLHKIFRRERMMGEWFQPRIIRSKRFTELLVECQNQLNDNEVPKFDGFGSKSTAYSKRNLYI